jgi:hypothetical protein
MTGRVLTTPFGLTMFTATVAAFTEGTEAKRAAANIITRVEMLMHAINFLFLIKCLFSYFLENVELNIKTFREKQKLTNTLKEKMFYSYHKTA